MSVRAACEEDWPTLARIHAASFADAWDEPALRALSARPGAIALTTGGAEPQAFVLAQCAADECEILTVATAPIARRRGFARELIAAAAVRAKAMGAATLYLEVAEDNAAARALYRGLGFAEAGRRRGYYARQGGAVDALLLKAALPLAPAIPLQTKGLI
jgi:[ribosomal protein S18]-alanine N-acetyltransferase